MMEAGILLSMMQWSPATYLLAAFQALPESGAAGCQWMEIRPRMEVFG